MRKGSDLIGKPILAFDSGEHFGQIRDLLLDDEQSQILGFLVREGSWLRGAQVLPLSAVQAIGPDALIIPSKEAIVPANREPDIQRILQRNNILKGIQVITSDGHNLGSIADLYFDEQSGALEGYEVSGSALATSSSRSLFLPAWPGVKVGGKVAFVPAEIMASLNSEVIDTTATPEARLEGGLQEPTRVLDEQMLEKDYDTHELMVGADSQTPQEPAPRKPSPIAGSQMPEPRKPAGERRAEVQRRVVPRQMPPISQEEQRAAITGKMTHWDVVAPNGSVLVKKGTTITSHIADAAQREGLLDELYWAAGGRVRIDLAGRARPSIDQARGRQVRWPVRASRGLLVAATGQIVTQRVIDRARLYRKEEALLEAVGLLSSGVGNGRQSDEQHVQQARQFRARLSGVWQGIQSRVHALRRYNIEQREAQRIKRALGRPATRVILDATDQVILDVGELITNEAVERARMAGVLEILLDSVYTKQPEFSEEELRASASRKAALEERREELS